MQLLSFQCLLVDDDLDDQEIFCMALKRISTLIDCQFADDGWQAVNKFLLDEGFIPAFIFIDVNMPRMNGICCLREIKKINRLKNVPCYMYSTSADEKMMAEAKNLGAVGFIIKQTSLQSLIKMLDGIFNF